ncbi:MAG TPA: BTAD domain-containing putative transcriptional regulator, partial [Mycobacteriales bacterium]|nr:BTAD domain-containing putative transcriptional regulator [Mycobacteriales bacterium]
MTDDTSLSDVQFFLMGSVEARAGSESVVLGRKQERCLIGLLLLDCGRPVSLERLADLLWDGTPPDRARSVIQTYVSRLRARLAPYGVRISGTHGYRIDVDPRDVDFHQLRTGVDLAAEEADPARRLALLHGPLGLCRGPLLGDVAPPGLRLRLGAEAEDLQSTARELCAEAELALGHPDKAIRLVEATAADRPVRERMVAVLMEAYRMSGRKSEAIGVYHAARHALVDDFGVEPGSRLRHLYDEILREDADAAVAATGEVRGAQLPPAAVPFVGRVREFAELDRIVLGAAPPGPRAVVVAGGAGLGKTALVVQWAHHRAGDFPDGQVYVDMRGFTAGTPTTASEAMTQVILALGVDSHRIPTEPGALQPFYRRLTARRRLLVVFDDVATADQVRPALPTGPHTATLITSRRRLFGLTALGDASGLELLPLPPGDALALMTQLLPEHRDNRAVLTDLADLCAYMPLFLRISAANVRLCGDPASFAAAMHGDRALDHLQSGADPTVGARSALGLSYRSLPDHARRLFRAAGRSPLRFVTPDSAGAMLGMDPAQGRWLLERIADVHLVEEFGFGRYRLHDLIRTFAAEQDTGSDGDQALRRLMTFYVGAVTHATATATANEIVTPEQPEPAVALPALSDPHAAMAWLDGELPNIAAVVRFAAEHGPPEPAWQISRRLTHYFWIRRTLPEWRAINEAALAAARAAD